MFEIVLNNIQTQLSIILELANEAVGTNFALGYVTEGWRCKFNKKTKKYDNDFVNPTSATLVGDALVASTERPARPVIWLWNDDYVQKMEAWGQE